MPRIAGINIPEKKKIEVALTYIYGIGEKLSHKILTEAGVDPSTRAHALTPEQVNKLRDIVEKQYRVEGDLRREIMLSVKRLKDIGTYRGMRHKRGLPVRGQRTKTNSRTRRGNVRRTAGSGKRKVDLK